MAQQVRSALADFQPKLVLFFASSIYKQPGAALKEAFPNSKIGHRTQAIHKDFLYLCAGLK